MKKSKHRLSSHRETKRPKKSSSCSASPSALSLLFSSDPVPSMLLRLSHVPHSSLPWYIFTSPPDFFENFSSPKSLPLRNATDKDPSFLGFAPGTIYGLNKVSTFLHLRSLIRIFVVNPSEIFTGRSRTQEAAFSSCRKQHYLIEKWSSFLFKEGVLFPTFRRFSDASGETPPPRVDRDFWLSYGFQI